MNIEQELRFNADRPTSRAIKRSDKINYMAIGLLEDQVLAKHKTPVATTLTVILGSVDFRIEGRVIRLEQFDTFDIPILVEHEVHGVGMKNIFTLIQEKE